MSYSFIPEDVAQFILESIDSVAQMEALLLLWDHQARKWSAEDLAKRLYISEEETAKVVDPLCARGFLVVEENDSYSYQYQPDSAELRSMVDRVAETYRQHLVPVTNLIHSKPKTRVQEFADAFRLRKDK